MRKFKRASGVLAGYHPKFRLPNQLLSRVFIVVAIFAVVFLSAESPLSYMLTQQALIVKAELNDPTLAITKYGRAAPPLDAGSPSPLQPYGAVSQEVHDQAPAAGVDPATDKQPTYDPTAVPNANTEDMGKRTSRSKTYNNPNGSTTTTLFGRDAFYEENGQSKQLGSRMTPDREGSDGKNGVLGYLGAGLGLTPLKGFRADDGPVKAKFHELTAGKGVSLMLDGQEVSMLPQTDHSGITPTHESHGGTDAVVYSNVWEGADLVYEYHGDVVKEIIVIRQKPTTNSFSFDLKGAALRYSPNKPGTIEGLVGKKVVFAMPELTVLAKELGPVGNSGAAYSINGNTITVALSQSWLDGLTEQNYPVAIDPTVGISNASNDYTDYKSDGYVCASSSCWLYAGNLNDNGAKYWRTALHIPFNVPAGQTASYANLHLEKQMSGPAWYGDNSSQTYYVNWANCFGFNCIGTNSPSMPITVSTSGDANIAPLVNWMQQNGVGDGWLIIHGDGAAFKAFNAYATHVDITYNSAPSATKVFPTTNNPVITTITPKLEITATDPNGDPLIYAFRVYNLNGGFMAGSGWINTPTWVVPDGLLQDGNTYKWSVAVWDGTSQVDAGISDFTIDLRTGKDKSQTYDTAGPVMVNMADGNTYTAAASHSIGALGGNIGIGLDYNTPSKSKKGLKGSYYNNGTQNPVLVRTDPNIDFEWSTASPMPGVVGADSFNVTWSGYFVAPVTGSYTFGGSNDDNFSFGIDTNADGQFEQQFNLSCCSSSKNWAPQSVSLTAGQVYPITATFIEATSGAYARLWVRMPDTTERIVPQDWLRTPVMADTQAQGMTGKFYKDDGSHDFTTNAYPFMVQRYNNINLDWGTGSPMPYDPGSEFNDGFMARFTGYLVVPTTGSYKFGSTADDGQRIFVNGSQVAGDWTIHGPNTVWSGYASLTAGQIVPVTLEYFEAAGGAQVNLQWDGPAGTGLIPSQYMLADYNVLPAGWSLSLDGNGNLPYERLNSFTNGSVDLLDGDGTNHRYVLNVTTGIYTPPVNEDGVLTRNQDGSYRLNDVDGRVYEFASDGTLRSVTAPTDDRKPAALKFDYQTIAGVPRLNKIIDGIDASRYGQLYYGGDSQCVTPSGFVPAPIGMLCAFKTYDNQVTNFYYKDAGSGTPKRLSRVELPGGALTDFESDGDGRITAVRDVLANDAIATGQRANDATVTTELAYDALGRAKSVKQPAATAGANRIEHTFEYYTGISGNGSAKRHIAGATEPNGYQQYMEYDALQRTTKVCDIAALCTTTEWHTDKDLVLSTTDPTGLKSTVIYDDVDRPADSYGPAPAAWYGSDRLPLAAYANQVPHNQTAYDQNIVGPEVTYYNYKSANKTLFGASKLRTTGIDTANPGTMSKNWGSTPPITIDTGLGANGWGLRATGKLRVTTSGDYTFHLWHDDGARLTIDNTQVVNDWTDGAYDNSTGYMHLDAGKVYTFVLEYYDTNLTNAQIDLRMAIGTPVAADNIFGTKLTPGYNLQTSQTGYDTTTGNVTTTTNYGSNPEFGLAGSTTLDPSGLNYTNTATYETPGAAYLRQTSKTLPGGGTTNYSYYTDTETRDNPCTTGTTEAFKQAGFMKLKTEPDPGTGGGSGGGSSAAPVVRSSNSGSVTSGALTLNKPSGTVNGDLLVMTASADLSASEDITYTIPSGWTSLLPLTRSDASGAGNNLQVWYKIANNEPANYAITPDHSNLIGGSILRIDGHDPTTPINVSGFTASPTGEASTPSVTTTVANDLLLRLATWDQSKTITSAPAGHTQAYYVHPSGHDSWGGYKEQASAGATGIAQFDLSSGSPYVGLTIAIAPQGSDGSPSAGRTSENIYDDAGHVVATRINNDAWSCTSYDSRGRATQAVVPTINGRAGRTVTTNYSYQGSPFKVQVIDSVAGSTVSEVDLLGRAVSTTDSFGNISTVTYDNLGRVANKTSPLGDESYTYDTYNRVTEYLHGGIKYATVTYDQYSRVQDVTYDQANSGQAPPPSSAPAVRSSSSGTTSSGALTLAKPTGTVNGDLLVMTASADLSASEVVTYTVPSGWTQLLANTRSDAASAGDNLQIWYKIANNEPANYAITPDHSNLIAGSIVRIDGHDASNPIDVLNVTTSTTGEALAPAVTTTIDNDLVMRLVTWDQSKTITAIPSGHTQAYHATASGHDNWGGYKTQATAGSTGVAQMDLSSGSPYVGFTVAIKPAGSTPPPSNKLKLEQIKRDAAGRSAGAVFRFSNGTAFDETVARSQSGMVTSATDTFGGNSVTNTYSYDKAGRLLEAVVDKNKYTYGYGAPSGSTCNQASANLNAHKNSNRTSYSLTNTVTNQVVASSAYCYDHADRLLASSDTQLGTPTYDDHGNTATLAGNGTPITFTYDASDSNTAIEQGPNKVTYLKTASGSVLRKKEYQSGSLTKSYRYLAGGAVMQSCSLTDDNNCATTDTYLNLPGAVTLTLSPANPDTTKQVVYSLKNSHADTAILAGSTGLPASSVFLYEPFGQTAVSVTFGTNSDPTNATDQPMGWAASPTRKVAGAFTIPIIQMGARVYLPTAARFLQLDPIEGGTANGYVYAGDPINQSDYSGRFAFVIPLVYGFVAAAVGIAASYIMNNPVVKKAGVNAINSVGSLISQGFKSVPQAAPQPPNRPNCRPTERANPIEYPRLNRPSNSYQYQAMNSLQKDLNRGIVSGERIISSDVIGDLRWSGFSKFQANFIAPDGSKISVHYMYDEDTCEYGQVKINK